VLSSSFLEAVAVLPGGTCMLSDHQSKLFALRARSRRSCSMPFAAVPLHLGERLTSQCRCCPHDRQNRLAQPVPWLAGHPRAFPVTEGSTARTGAGQWTSSVVGDGVEIPPPFTSPRRHGLDRLAKVPSPSHPRLVRLPHSVLATLFCLHAVRVVQPISEHRYCNAELRRCPAFRCI
jgi:hypothetical protein